MTVGQLLQRDARIAALEALGDQRTIAEQDELLILERRRDRQWGELAHRIAQTQRRAAELEAYARQIGLPFHA